MIVCSAGAEYHVLDFFTRSAVEYDKHVGDLVTALAKRPYDDFKTTDAFFEAYTDRACCRRSGSST